jgi:hypothetical protein
MLSRFTFTSRAVSLSSLRLLSSSATMRADNTPHFRTSTAQAPEPTYDHPLHHPVYTAAELDGVKMLHKAPVDLVQKIAHYAVRTVRTLFDVASGYSFGKVSEAKLLRRILFLETTAGIPGTVAATLRHLRSLRRVQRDHGWIPGLLEESENERMHALMFSSLKTPGPMFRFSVLVAQGVFWNLFFTAYLASPRFCHSFVGYLEEEAVRTYTVVLAHLDNGDLPLWSKMPAPEIAQRYYKLPANSTMRDVLLNVRADEAWHRDTNHLFASLGPDDMNPLVMKK